MKETNVLKTRSRRMSEERPAEPSHCPAGTSRLDPSSGDKEGCREPGPSGSPVNWERGRAAA